MYGSLPAQKFEGAEICEIEKQNVLKKSFNFKNKLISREL